MSKTQIVATIGPVSNTPEMLLQMWEAGMTIARLNGSHNSLEWHAETIGLIRRILPNVPILLDIPGRKIRTQMLAVEPRFKTGDTIILTTDSSYSNPDKVPVNYQSLHEDLSPGDIVFADDGTLKFSVGKVAGRDIFLRAECNGQLKSCKGINVPSVRLKTQMITERDHQMIAFAIEHGVDFIGISFVESAEHVNAIRKLTRGGWPRIVAKVENKAGMDNLRQILDAADAVMIDRGDLSVETNVENVALYQKDILRQAQAHGKPVIVATEMLNNMIQNCFPTKAEVSDITNAVLDGCAATMLSGETAVGAYPVEAVATMRQITDTAMAHLCAHGDKTDSPDPDQPQAMGQAIALICRQLPITKIVAITVSGYAARMISVQRPRQPILAVSNDAMAARSFNLLSGTEGIYLDIPFSKTSTDHIALCLKALWQQGNLGQEDLILVTAVGYPRSGNRMNLMQTHSIADLVEALGWDSPDNPQVVVAAA